MTWFPKSLLHAGVGIDLDLSHAVPNERYECLTCHLRCTLTTNGRCGYCNSEAVISLNLVEASCER